MLPGEHRIVAYNGLRSVSTTLTTKAGKEYRVALALPPIVPVSFVPPLAPLSPPGWWISRTPPPPTETFRWWPVAVGGAFVAAGLALGTGLSIASNSAGTSATHELATIQVEGKSCTNPPIDPRCAVYDQFNSQSATYSTAAIATFIAAGAISAGIIGYAIYENRRVTIATTVSGVVGKYQW